MSFDFEAAALGVEVAPARQAKPFPAHSSTDVDEFLDLPRASHSRHSRGEGENGSSASRPTEHLVGNRPLSAAKLEGVVCRERSGKSRDIADTLGHELLQGRRSLDERHAEKMMLEQRIEQARQRLKTGQDDRHQISVELSRRRADVEHLFTTLDFGRQQIEEVEGELASLRVMHQALTPQELGKLQQRFGPLRSAGPAMAAAVAHATEQRSAQNRVSLKSLSDLAEKARRESRRKFELQAKQELLLSTQKQAEQDRAYAQKELELVRSALSGLRDDRLRLSQEGSDAFREATRLAEGAGIGPGAVRDLILSHGGPHQPHEPHRSRDPGQQRPGAGRRHRDTNPFPNSNDDGVTWWTAMLQKGGADAAGAVPTHWAHFPGV